MQTYQIGANEAGQRMDKFLRKFMPKARDSFIYKMLRKKNIVLNGGRAEGKEILAEGDTVSFFFADETYELFTGRRAAFSPAQPAKAALPSGHLPRCEEYRSAYDRLSGISIVHEDGDILILDKPAGVLTQKADSREPSLNEWMIGYLLHEQKLSVDSLLTFRPSVANRLDRNTSGLVLCGISLRGSQMLSGLIRDRRIGKYYLAIVKGNVREAGEINGFLRKDARTNKVSAAGEEGSAARTVYEPLAHGRDCTCLKVKLITGKTHQIRAHMAGMGHPILGDLKYGDTAVNEKYRRLCGVKCQLLHAYRVEFPGLEEPFGNLSRRTFTAPLPKIFEEVFAYGDMEFPRTQGFHTGGTDQQDE